MILGTYVSPDDLKEIDIHTSQERDDNILAKIALNASRDWETLTRDRSFLPVRQTRYFDHPRQSFLNLSVDSDLVEIIQLGLDDFTTTIPLADMWLKSGDNYNRLPANKIEIDPDSGSTFSPDRTQRSILVDGWWGYMPHWADPNGGAFIDPLTTASGFTATTITVGDADGINVLGVTPAFKLFDLVRLTEGSAVELAYITAINATTNVLTVIRGVNGTSVLGTPEATVLVFQPDQTVAKAVRRLAAWYFRQKDTSRPDTDRPIITNGGVVLPSNFPPDIIRVADTYRRVAL